MHLTISPAKCRPFCLGLNALKYHYTCLQISMSVSAPHVPMLATVPTRSMDTTVPANQGRWVSTVKRVSLLQCQKLGMIYPRPT